jgi:type VI protein secretion system component Hcp
MSHFAQARGDAESFANSFENKARWNSANDELDRDTLLENQKRGYGSNLEPCGDFRMVRNIDLHNPQLADKCLC